MSIMDIRINKLFVNACDVIRALYTTGRLDNYNIMVDRWDNVRKKDREGCPLLDSKTTFILYVHFTKLLDAGEKGIFTYHELEQSTVEVAELLTSIFLEKCISYKLLLKHPEVMTYMSTPDVISYDDVKNEEFLKMIIEVLLERELWIEAERVQKVLDKNIRLGVFANY